MKTKRFLSILLSLVLVLGMFPGMSLTTYAEGNTKTITPGTDNAKTGTGTMTITLKIKDAQTITASDVTATYGDTDKSVSGTTTGDGAIRYSVKSGDAVTVDENTGALTIVKAGSAVITVTAAETATYAQATKDVNVTVNTKAMTVSAENVNVTVDGQPHGITVNVTDPASGATVKYGTEVGTYNLDASPTQTEAGELTVYYQVTADNYTTYTGSAKVTVNDKSTQTINASDVTATYGDTDKKVEATTDGNGAISYAVKEGSADYIDVDSATGALTIKKVGTATVIVTAAETATYAQATKEVTVTINKANAVAASVTANNRTYDGTEKPLVTVTGEATGGTMQYALGTKDATTGEYSASIPKETNAGTYYVWYKAVGDDAHVNSEPGVVTVTIGEEILVKYESNGGSGTMNDQKVEKGVDTALNANTFTRDGYTFKEWNTKADGSGDSYNDKAEVNLDSSLTLYAQWKEIEKHTHHLEKVEAVEPGCETEGNKEYYRCTDESCDKWFEDVTMTSEITDKESVIIKAKGHKWNNGEVTKEPTYDEEGIKTYTCENDPSHTKEETIPKKTREYSNDSSSGSSDSSSESSGGGSGRNSGSISKQILDVNGNVVGGSSTNHQPDSGMPVSDRGGSWGGAANIWSYIKSDGALARNEWLNLEYNGHTYWYYFNDGALMQTDWLNLNGATYYFVPEGDGWRGRMATGWQQIGEKWYYFEPTAGAYQGVLYRGAVTPDGHTVGADGAWNGVGAAPVGQE